MNMDDIHMPTVPSGPTTQLNGINGTTPKSFEDLSTEKARLEEELKSLSAVLDSHGVNMNTGLTTFDGFPRSDIDVAQIRTTRARIIHLRNDYKATMSALELAVQARFAALAANPPAPPSSSQLTSNTSTLASRPAIGSALEDTDRPFAQVDEVAASGPAEAAGLKVGDRIVRFGGANVGNHRGLRMVGEVVGGNEGREILVIVLRDGQQQRLRLTPRRDWGGRGLLGCHLVPV